MLKLSNKNLTKYIELCWIFILIWDLTHDLLDKKIYAKLNVFWTKLFYKSSILFKFTFYIHFLKTGKRSYYFLQIQESFHFLPSRYICNNTYWRFDRKHVAVVLAGFDVSSDVREEVEVVLVLTCTEDVPDLVVTDHLLQCTCSTW